MSEKIRLDFKILIYREDEWWIAHCLEMDLPAEGETLEKAMHNLVDLFKVQIESALEEGNLDSIFSPAPPELWSMYAIARDKSFKQRPPKPVNRMEFRELVPA